MADRYPHVYVFDGPFGDAGSGRCVHCGVSDEDESADMECPVLLRARVDDLERCYCTHNVAATLTAENDDRLRRDA